MYILCSYYLLLQIIWKYFYSCKSAREHATLCQLRNLINRSNVSNKTKGNFNSCDDFLVLVITCHMLAAAMEYLGMKALDDTPAENVVPNVSEVWTLTKEKRQDLLECICAGIVDRHIPFQFHGSTTPINDQVSLTHVCLLINFYTRISHINMITLFTLHWYIYRYTSTVGNCYVLAAFIWSLLMELEKVMVCEFTDAGSISFHYLKAPTELTIRLKPLTFLTNSSSS